jgi:hypothetical protein
MGNRNSNVQIAKFQLAQVESRLLNDPHNIILQTLHYKIKKLIDLSESTECEETVEKIPIKTRKSTSTVLQIDSVSKNQPSFLASARIGDECEILLDGVFSKEAPALEIWHHSIIRDISPDSSSAAVLITDIGTVVEVSSQKIRKFQTSRDTIKSGHSLSHSNRNIKAIKSKDFNYNPSKKIIKTLSKEVSELEKSQKSWIEFNKALSKNR